jgi:hypothetical protein
MNRKKWRIHCNHFSLSNWRRCLRYKWSHTLKQILKVLLRQPRISQSLSLAPEQKDIFKDLILKKRQKKRKKKWQHGVEEDVKRKFKFLNLVLNSLTCLNIIRFNKREITNKILPHSHFHHKNHNLWIII